MRYINRIEKHPEWYNALTGNCTTQIRGHTAPYTGKTRWDWRILLNGQLDEMAYENGLLNQSLAFETLRRKSIINNGQNPGSKSGFLHADSAGLPGMETMKDSGIKPSGK